MSGSQSITDFIISFFLVAQDQQLQIDSAHNLKSKLIHVISKKNDLCHTTKKIILVQCRDLFYKPLQLRHFMFLFKELNFKTETQSLKTSLRL